VRVGIVSVYVDYHRRGRKNPHSLQPQIGPLLAALLPRDVEIEIVNETSHDLDWRRDYDLLFISSMHSDMDRARQISHYWRRRGARTVIGGSFASTFPGLCEPWFDAVVVGDPEGSVPQVYADFCAGSLRRRYVSPPYAVESAATPRFDLFAGKKHYALSLEATRGCPFSCNFCVLTGLGTRHHARPVQAVVRDIVAGQRLLAGTMPAHKRRIVGFCDNNIGGNLAYLRALCEALGPLRIQWYGAATFNVIANPELVRTMARSGCRALFVGLESFNPATLADMKKYQNVIHKMRSALDCCRGHGILIVSGLMVSPLADSPEDIRNIPRNLSRCGLHVPTFVSFESPIPGTPHFDALGRHTRPPAFMPNVLLRDLAGYTLAVRPRKSSVAEFIAAYREMVREVFSARRRLNKLVHDVPRFLAGGHWLPALIDAFDMATMQAGASDFPLRTYIAGTEVPPPESVPLTSGDFESDAERAAVLEPWRVTDEAGALLPQWRHSRPVFQPHVPAPSRTGIPVGSGAA
jgi:Radical SAM superfamily